MNYTNGLPKGAVIMWHGEVNDIPDGWAICNGENGTPDLRNRFIVGVHFNTDTEKKAAEEKMKQNISIKKAEVEEKTWKFQEAVSQYQRDPNNPQYTNNYSNCSIELNNSVKEMDTLEKDSYILSTTKSKLNDKGGENYVKLTIDEIPSHKHNLTYSDTAKTVAHGKQGWPENDNFNGVYATDRTGVYGSDPMYSTGGDKPHENRPPYYALFFIKRII